MALAISAQNIVKNYNGVPAVRGISLEIQQGECFGILGPNGAGKSTFMKMLYGQAIPTSGDLFVLGINVKSQIHEVKSRIGVVPQEDALDTDFSVLENLKLFASYFGLDPDASDVKIDHLLADMKLLEKKHQHVEALSGGMKRRLAIARALIHTPELLILDEPTTGLDPQARLWIWNYFQQLKAQKTTILLTTHYMEEAEKLCDRIAIVDQGKILDIGTSSELIKKYVGTEVVEIDIQDNLNYWIDKIRLSQLEHQKFENKIFVYFSSFDERQKFVLNIQHSHYLVRSANLNDVFLKATGYQIRSDS